MLLFQSFIKCSKNQNKINYDNFMKYILLSKYYQSISDIKILKKIYDNKNQIQNGQINDEQNKILILSSTFYYQKNISCCL